MKEKNTCRMAQQDEGNGKQLSRRNFVSAVGLATAGVVASACSRDANPLASDQSDLKQPVTPPSGQAVGSSGDDKVKVATNNIATYDYDTLRANIESAVDKIGGLSDICKSGDVVGIKLNLTAGQSSADWGVKNYGLEPQEFYLTHPTIMQIVGELFKDAGAGKIYIMEAINDFETYQRYGYEDAEKYLGAELVDLNNKKPYGSFSEITIPNPQSKYESYAHHGRLHELDCFVSLPKIKRHYGAGITNAMKNMIGSTPKDAYNNGQTWRSDFHKSASGSGGYSGNQNLVRTIVDLCQIRPIHFSVSDGIMTAANGENPGKTGFKPIRFDTLVTSKDVVAADAIATQVMGFDPMAADKTGAFGSSSLPGNFSGTDNYLRIAEEVGLGTHDLAKIQVIDASLNTRVSYRG